MSDNKSCTTCLYEYACDWTPARDEESCSNWRPDDQVNGDLVLVANY